MAINTMDYSKVDSFIPEILANKVLQLLPSYMNLARTVSKDIDYTPERKGRVITIPMTGTLSANEKTANNPVTLQNPADSETTITLDQHYEVSFSPEDIARTFARADLIDTYAMDATIVLAEKIESSIASLYSVAGSYVEADGDSVSAIARNDIIDVRTALADAKVPLLAPKVLHLSTASYAELLKQTSLMDFDKTGTASNLMAGSMGRILGFDYFETQLIQGVGSPSVDHNLAFTSDAIVLAVRPLTMDAEMFGGAKQMIVSDVNSGLSLRMTTSYNASYLAPQITLDVLWGVKAVRPEHLIDFRV